MTVYELIETLQKLEDKNIPVMFSYDSRVMYCGVTVVDLVRDNLGQDQYIVLREEDSDEYEFACPHKSEKDFLNESRKYHEEEVGKYKKEYEEDEIWGSFYKQYVKNDPQAYIDKQIENDLKSFRRNVEKSKENIALYLEWKKE